MNTRIFLRPDTILLFGLNLVVGGLCVDPPLLSFDY